MQEELDRMYKKANYFSKSDGHQDGIGYSSDHYLDSEKLLGVVSSELQALEHDVYLDGADLLEIGCATGEFLHAARKAGAQVTGIEPNAWACDRIDEKFGIEVVCSTLEEYESEKVFDIVVAREVIEHFSEASLFMQRAAALIRTGGKLVLTTPNYGSGKRVGEKWIGFQGSLEHVLFFSVESLERIAASTGLNLVAWWTYGQMPTACEQIGGRVASPSREIVKRLFDSVGLLEAVRWMRAAVNREEEPIVWTRYGTGHRLMVVFQKNIEYER